MEYNKINGYYVEGVPNTDGSVHEKKEFTELCTNGLNLAAAKRYIKYLELQNRNSAFVEYIPDDLKNNGIKKQNDDDTKFLPKYITIVKNKNDEKIGYKINSFRLNNKKIGKIFAHSMKPLEELYAKTLDYLRDLIKQEQSNIKAENNTQTKNSDEASFDNVKGKINNRWKRYYEI